MSPARFPTTRSSLSNSWASSTLPISFSSPVSFFPSVSWNSYRSRSVNRFWLLARSSWSCGASTNERLPSGATKVSRPDSRTASTGTTTNNSLLVRRFNFREWMWRSSRSMTRTWSARRSFASTCPWKIGHCVGFGGTPEPSFPFNRLESATPYGSSPLGSPLLLRWNGRVELPYAGWGCRSFRRSSRALPCSVE